MEDIEKLMLDAGDAAEEEKEEEPQDDENGEEEEDSQESEESSPKATPEAKTEKPKEVVPTEDIKKSMVDHATDMMFLMVGGFILQLLNTDQELCKAYKDNKVELPGIVGYIIEKVHPLARKCDVSAIQTQGGQYGVSLACITSEAIWDWAREYCHLPPKPKEQPKKAEGKSDKTENPKKEAKKVEPKKEDPKSVESKKPKFEQINFDDLLFGGTNNGKNNA